jgi:hypothetical protein
MGTMHNVKHSEKEKLLFFPPYENAFHSFKAQVRLDSIASFFHSFPISTAAIVSTQKQ